jgi:CRISPR-associated endonuclease/helicase Cas3
LPPDPADAVELVRDLPPASWETFPVPCRTARTVLRELLDTGEKPLVRVRGEDIAPLRLRTRADGAMVPDMRPGDVVVIDSSSQIFTPTEGVFSPPVVVPPASEDDQDGLDARRRAVADDVLHRQPDPRRGDLLLRVEWSPGHKQIGGLDAGTAQRILNEAGEGFDDRNERARRDHLASLLADWPRDQIDGDLRATLEAVVDLLGGPVKHSDVTMCDTEEGRSRIVVADRRRAASDEDLRQVFTPRDEKAAPVLLDDHQAQVADRASALGQRIGLSGDLADALRLAGLHHDDGKADPRFQSFRLGADCSGPLLAKSDPRNTVRQVRERQAEGGLPIRWRHEQRSVADSWDHLHASPGADPLLTARLVGTSHGYGRSGFPHTAAQLAGDHDSEQWRRHASDLFDSGRWDYLIETTHIRYGVWGCAYLEALLRAADSQISREGR